MGVDRGPENGASVRRGNKGFVGGQQDVLPRDIPLPGSDEFSEPGHCQHGYSGPDGDDHR